MRAGVRTAQKAATRAKILAAAAQLFRTEGYEATTVRDIARAAKVSTGAFFGNWPSKAEIYAQIYGHAPITPEQGRELAQALAFAAGLIRSNQPWSAGCDDVIGKALAKVRAGVALTIDELEAA